MQVRTVRGYDFYEVSSSMQKAIRRGDAKMAGYFALELYQSNYAQYVWKRLLIISAEDCAGLVTREIEALYRSCLLVKTPKPEKGPGRLFVAKAVIILSRAAKSRDADHLICLVYDNHNVEEAEIQTYLAAVDRTHYAIPEYAYDVHTLKGKRAGKTKADFFQSEHKALFPRQLGFFDSLLEGKK